MPLKKSLIREFLRVMDATDLEDLNRREVRIKLPCGTEVVFKLNAKNKFFKKLQIVKKD